MQFSTPVPVPQYSHPMGYDSAVVSLGSCFAVNIGAKFGYHKFRNTTNPFGILFHPLALEKFVGFAVNRKTFTEADIFFHNERWHCFDAHSDLSHPDKEQLLHNLTAQAASAHHALAAATHLIITLGTAWVYRHIKSNELVANCHKVPQRDFGKELLSVSAISNSIASMLHMLRDINPKLQVIFTVSPVRHIKDGFVENQRSKSHLFAGMHEAIQNTTNCYYFPSYEIMMDELRDYRFYADDMIHPSSMAIDYIWERFGQSCIAPGAQPVMKEVDQIQKALAHLPFNPEGEQHKKFLTNVRERIAKLQEKYPHMLF